MNPKTFPCLLHPGEIVGWSILLRKGWHKPHQGPSPQGSFHPQTQRSAQPISLPSHKGNQCQDFFLSFKHLQVIKLVT